MYYLSTNSLRSCMNAPFWLGVAALAAESEATLMRATAMGARARRRTARQTAREARRHRSRGVRRPR